MLKIFTSTSAKLAEGAYNKYLAEFATNHASSKRVLLDSDSEDLVATLRECLVSRDLFGGEVICFGRRVLGKLEDLTIEDLDKSATSYVFLEPELTAAEQKKHKDYLEIVVSNKPDDVSPSKKSKISPFAITEKFAMRDKRGTWVEYQRSLMAGVDPEDIYFKLQWQTRSLLAAKLSGTASEAGMKDYPYNKAKAALPKFKSGEVEKMSNQLLQVWHAGHGGGQEFPLALEQFILSV